VFERSTRSAVGRGKPEEPRPGGVRVAIRTQVPAAEAAASRGSAPAKEAGVEHAPASVTLADVAAADGGAGAPARRRTFVIGDAGSDWSDPRPGDRNCAQPETPGSDVEKTSAGGGALSGAHALEACASRLSSQSP